MKLSFNSWVYGSFPAWLPSYPLEEVIKRLSAIGYDGIEIGAASPHAWPGYTDKDRRREIKRLLDEQGIEVSSICPALGGGPGLNPTSPIESERKASVDYYKECVDLAADLGSKIVIWVGGWMVYGVSKDQAWEWGRKALIECTKYADDKRILMVVEPTSADSDVIETVDDAIKLMKETELANVKVMFDTFHAIYRNEVMADYVRKMGKDLAHIHISDANRLPPGQGGKDFRPLLKALKEVGFDGFLTQEVAFGSRSSDPDACALQGYEYLKSLLQEI